MGTAVGAAVGALTVLMKMIDLPPAPEEAPGMVTVAPGGTILPLHLYIESALELYVYWSQTPLVFAM